MDKSFNHLKEYEWMCDLWVPDDPVNKYSGKISYNPGNGIQFEIFVTHGIELIKSAKTLYGASFEAGLFTLKGCMLQSSAANAHSVKVSMFASYMVFEGHYSDDCEFQCCRFKTNNLDRFSGRFQSQKFSEGWKQRYLVGNLKVSTFH